MLDGGQQYDLAVSFAGAQRPLARRFARACEALGLSVFYDENVTEQMWGRDFIQEFRRVYGGELARYVVPFLSTEYLAGPYPMDEFDAANTYAVQRRDDPFLLPVTVGEVEIPENLLRSSICYLRSEDYSPEELARIASDRVRGAAATVPAPAPSVTLRLPNVAPTSFSGFTTLDEGLARIGERFRQAESALVGFGYTCHVRTGDRSVHVRVERQGTQVYGLTVQLRDGLGGDQLTVSFGWPSTAGSGINAWATAEWDADAGEGRFKYYDFTHGNPDRLLSADDLFDRLWQGIIDFIQQTHGRRA